MGPFPRTAKGNAYALVIIDLHSRILYSVPLPNTTSDSTIQSLHKLFSERGVPFALVSDCGRSFISKKFQTFCRYFGIHHSLTTPHRPMANGIVERAIRTIKSLLRAWAHQCQLATAKWDKKLQEFTAAYNLIPHSSTGIAPNFLDGLPAMAAPALSWVPWVPPRSNPPDRLAAMQKSAVRRAHERMRRNEGRRNQPPLPLGTLVLKRRFHPVADFPGKALRPPWDGPFKIIMQTSPTTYSIARPGTSSLHTVHRDLIRPFRA